METFNVPFSEKAGFNSELVFYYCGYEECEPGHSWGPGLRDHYLIHYVISGKGVYRSEGVDYTLREGEAFLIRPGEVSFYKADKDRPWTYLWVGFHGLNAESFLERAGFEGLFSVLDCHGDGELAKILQEMVDCQSDITLRDVKQTGLLYSFVARLIEIGGGKPPSAESENAREGYFLKAVDYICRNFSQPISINGIAKYIGIDRKYLHKIFREYANQSPQGFVISFRIERACALLKNSGLKIGDVSSSVGYSDPLLFSKIFKKWKGLSPTEFRS